jgi:hypothetical protein
MTEEPEEANTSSNNNADQNNNKNKGNGCMSAKGIVFLLCLGILIGGAIVGIAVGVSLANDEEDVVPTSPNAPLPSPPSPAPSTLPTTPAPITAQDAAVLELFASVVGDDVYVQGTTAYLAAQWMLFQDPRDDDSLLVREASDEEAGIY